MARGAFINCFLGAGHSPCDTFIIAYQTSFLSPIARYDAPRDPTTPVNSILMVRTVMYASAIPESNNGGLSIYYTGKVLTRN